MSKTSTSSTRRLPARLALAAGACAGAALLVACKSTPLPPQPPWPAGPPVANVPVAPPVPPPAPAPSPRASFIRPADGPVIGRFDGTRNKGLDIAGSTGDPILAAADGRVVIVSKELRGYGTMVILKHGDTFITAYGHLDRALVKENEVVRQGQKIAEMGKTGTDRVKVHFEIRKQGTAVDPEPYLQGLQH